MSHHVVRPIMALTIALQFITVTATQDYNFGKTLPVNLPTMEDLRVKNLEKVYPAYASFEGQMFAGSLPIDHEQPNDGAKSLPPRTGNLHFWLFVPDSPTAPNTMVSWFNGGPGCSSLATGIMFEHGPVTVPLHPAGWCCEGANEPLQPNEYAWTNATVMLYVEQPIGVGFSEATNGTPPPSSEDDVAADFESFLQNFYRVFGDLTSHSLYLVGESYAGIYIPSIARGIYLRNREQEKMDRDEENDRIHISLGGVAIGNGKIDAISQDPAVIDFSYYHGLIDGPTRDLFHAEWESCMANVNLKDGEIGGAAGKVKDHQDSSLDAPFHPFTVRDDCGVLGAVLTAAGADAFEGQPGGPNLYEYSTWDPYAAGEFDWGTVGSFYNNIKVQKALNVPAHRLGMHWQGCIPELEDVDKRRRLSRTSSRSLLEDTDESTEQQQHHPHRKLFMDNDTPWSVVPYLAQLLDEASIDVMLYSGDRDIICCTQGTEEALRKMDWTGTRDPAPGSNSIAGNFVENAWTHAPRGLWLYNNSYPAGYVKSYKNLKLVTIYNAGHMVPYNQPGPGLDMIERYLRKESFYDRPLVNFLSNNARDNVTATTKSIDSSGLRTSSPSSLPAAKADEGVQSRASKNATVASVSAGLMATIAVAFIVGFFVARFTTRSTIVQEGDDPDGIAIPVGKNGYGSIPSS